MALWKQQAGQSPSARVRGEARRALALWVALVVVGVGRHGDAGAEGLRAGSALVATVRVGRAPTILAVDGRRGHVFVLSYGPLNPNGVLPRNAAPPASVGMLDAATGRVLRTIPVVAFPQALAVDGRIGRAFVSSEGPTGANGGPGGPGTVTVLDTTTGAVVATVRLDARVYDAGGGAVAVDEAAGRVYVVVENGVEILDATTGRVRRRLHGPFAGAIALAPRAARALIAGNGAVALLDTARGSALSSVPDFGGAQAPAVDDRAGRGFFLYGNFHNGTLRALDLRTGATLYDIPTGPEATTVAVDAACSRVYVDTYDTGTELTSIATLDAATGKKVYAVSLGSHTGLPYRASGGEQYQYLAVAEAAGRVFALTAGPPAGVAGRLLTLDAATGHILGGVAVGKDPQAVAVDTQRGRVYVANRGDDTVSVFDATKL
jgi:DNA-binding beta-propeller fold protein YncE